MNETNFISVFTPSQASPDDLEKIFVQRHTLLRDAEERVRESVSSGNKHHLLFVGPRGSGKTHFVSMLVHRVGSDPKLEQNLDIAWLNEDETCTTFLDLLIKVYEALSKRYPERFEMEKIEPLYDRGPAEAEAFLGYLLLDLIGERTPLIVVENLDILFQSIGDEGQKKLRAYLQEHPVFAFLATAQALVDDLTNRDGPFFGFFQTEHLKPLSFKDAVDLLGKIATKNEDKELKIFLATAKGRSRARALHFLSGGNHRIFVVLSQFITRENIEEMVVPFQKMVDELTPYYQERVRALPPLQRKIVEFLCKCAETVSVKKIAKRMLSTSQTVSSQLKDLRAKGYVKSHAQGRESLYEMSEPLMRICVEVKENQTYGPLRLLVDFIRVWYETDELAKRMEKSEKGSVAYSYFETACERLAAEGNLRQKILVNELRLRLSTKIPGQELSDLLEKLEDAPEEFALALDCLTEGRWDECLELLSAATTNFASKDMLLRGQFFSVLSEEGKAIADYTAVVELKGAPVEEVAKALLYRGITHGQAGDAEKAIADYTAVVELKGAPVEEVARALLHRGITHGDAEKAIADYTALVELKGAPVEEVAMALFLRGLNFSRAGEFESAQLDFEAVLQIKGIPKKIYSDTVLGLAEIRGRQGRWDEAFEQLDEGLLQGQGASPKYVGDLEELIEILFQAGLAKTTLEANVRALLDVAQRREVLVELGESLVRHLGALNKSEEDADPIWLERWSEVWINTTTDIPELAISMRMFRHGVSFLCSKTNDETLLHHLKSEERSLLRRTLGLDSDPE